MIQQIAKELHDRYQKWIGLMREKRNFRWGSWVRGIIWLVLLFFFLVIFLHSLQAGGLPTIVTIVARNDLPAFTVLTQEKIALMQGDREKNPSPQDDPSVKKQEEALYQHVTLRPYEKGEKIQLNDLGPRLPAGRGYQIREIKASASLAWIQAGDMLTFTLVACSSPTPNTNTPCAPNTSPVLLKNVVIIQAGKPNQDSLVALQVAIPVEENTSSVAFLDAGGNSIVAYPAATITG